MRPLPRSVVFWTLFALLMFGEWLMARGALTQGAGALQLMKSAKASRATAALEVPEAAIPPVRRFYFAVTAYNLDLESGYSNEVAWTNAYPALAWDASTNATGYRVYRGRETGTYTNSWNAGSNLTFTVPRPPVKSNFVITVTSSRCTNLLWAPKLSGPWTLAGYTNLPPTTNPPWGPSRFWRGIGRPYGIKTVEAKGWWQ